MGEHAMTDEERALKFVENLLKGKIQEESQKENPPAPPLSPEQGYILNAMVASVFLHLGEHDIEDPCAVYNKLIPKLAERINFYALDSAKNENRESKKTVKILREIANLLALYHELWHDFADGINALTGEDDE